MSDTEHTDESVWLEDRVHELYYSTKAREKALAAAEIQPGKLAADIGAGTGFITEALCQNGLEVIAIDCCATVLGEMKKKFENSAAIHYKIGDAKRLPIPDETIDYVFANMFLHHIDSPLEAIKEMTRVLKSGGKLVIIDFDEHNIEYLKHECRDRWMGFKKDALSQWFNEAGLKNSNIQYITESCCTEQVRIFIASGVK